MLAKRILPCLDCDLAVPEGRVVKGVEFKEIKHAGIPEELAERYYLEGADELVFLDITASKHRRNTMDEVIERVAQKVFIPLTVGGGIKSVEDATRVFRSGADKVSINTAAIKNPGLIKDISSEYGSQACVVAIDVKRNYNISQGENIFSNNGNDFWFECSMYGGSSFTGIDAVSWAIKAESLGAGEILLTSMDADGTNSGFDLVLTGEVSKRLKIPVIASGGC